MLDYSNMNWHALRRTASKLGIKADGAKLELIKKLDEKFPN